MANKVILVTGASSGIGEALCRTLAAAGHRVYGLSRSGRAPEGCSALTADVTDEGAVRAAVAAVLSEAGRLDAAVLAAGYGISGAVEFTAQEEALRQYQVNLLGVTNCLTALTAPLRESRGRVIAIGSAAALFPIPFQAHYSASKAALNGLMRAYAMEVRRFGIKAGAWMLGDVSTGFTAARSKSEEGDALYGGRICRGVAAMERDEQNGAAPEAIARAIARRLFKRRLPTLATVGFKYRALALLSRLLPTSLQDRILAKLYS